MKQPSNPYLHPVGFPGAAGPPSFRPSSPSLFGAAPVATPGAPAPAPAPGAYQPYYQQHQQQQQQQQQFYQQQAYQAYYQQQQHHQPQQTNLAPATTSSMRVSQGYMQTQHQQQQQQQQQQQPLYQQPGAYQPPAPSYQPMPPSYQAAVQQQNNHWDIPFAELQLGKELGRGAFGVVFKGRWRLTDVAVKINQAKLSAEDLRTFQAETQLMMNLRPHKNVVQLRGVCQNPLCVVIDFVDGGSLESRLHDLSKPVDWKQIFQISQGICAGMLHIHLEGIVHRDLASRNVLLDSNQNALIADFGLSAQTFGVVKQEQGFFRGPYKWMAPESLAVNQFSCASDVWAFGVTLWELLSRRLPFEDKSIYVVKDEVITKKLRLPLPNKWPELWRNLLTACWRTDPAMRPDMATVGGWLHQMQIDYEKNPTADGYNVLPAVTADELGIRLPEAKDHTAASAPVTIEPPVLLTTGHSVSAAPLDAPTEKLASLSLHNSAGPLTTPTGEPSVKSDPSHRPAGDFALLPASPSPVAPVASAPPPVAPVATTAATAPLSASPSPVAPVASTPPVAATAAPAVGSHFPVAEHRPASSSGSVPNLSEKQAPHSPAVRHRSAKGGIFEAVAKANSVSTDNLELVDARPDSKHSPVPERK